MEAQYKFAKHQCELHLNMALLVVVLHQNVNDSAICHVSHANVDIPTFTDPSNASA